MRDRWRRRRSPRSAAATALVLAALGCGRSDRTRASANSAGGDTLSDSAAAARARALAGSARASGTYLALTVTGARHFDGPLGARASCTYGETDGSRTLEVEGIGRDAQVTFEIVNPAEGTAPVTLASRIRDRRAHISSVQFTLHSQSYAAGAGSATITDPLGRAGTLQARNFSVLDPKRRGRRGIDLRIRVDWQCE